MTLPKSDLLRQTAHKLVSPGKGLLAMDESPATCNQRLAEAGIPTTAAYRRRYREMIIGTPEIEKFISGAILCDETFNQATFQKQTVAELLSSRGIVPGIKVDQGTVPMANFPAEKITAGLDGLSTRLETYQRQGAGFAKWRAVVQPGAGLPSAACLHFNAQLLARYAAQCQEALLVPVVEPEVLMTGAHTLDVCDAVTREFLYQVFAALHEHRVELSGLLLKANMILPGNTCPIQSTTAEIVRATIGCLLDLVPAAVPGVVFLSGGQGAVTASERLNAMNSGYCTQLPWTLSFSFSRALLQPALHLWRGKKQNVTAAQQALRHRAACNHAACLGLYQASLEDRINKPDTR